MTAGVQSPNCMSGNPPVLIEHGVMDIWIEYFTSMYYVLNALEAPGTTTYERAFGVFAELMRDIILGLVASLITTISLASGSIDAESSLKLRGLKTWMSAKNLPKSFQAKTMEYFHELWSNPGMGDLGQVLKVMPPAMRSTVTEFMYKRFLSSMPLFRTLSDEVISSLCHHVRPLIALKGQEVMKEGTVGREMYMVMAGEVEVMRDGERLGFLSEGAFFGEVPVLDSTPGAERRTRTVRSVTDNTELCYITKDSMDEMQSKYPEMQARLRRFVRTGALRGKKLDDATLKKLNMTREEMERLSSTYSQIQDASRQIRKDKNWGQEKAIPWKVVESQLEKTEERRVAFEADAVGDAENGDSASGGKGTGGRMKRTQSMNEMNVGRLSCGVSHSALPLDSTDEADGGDAQPDGAISLVPDGKAPAGNLGGGAAEVRLVRVEKDMANMARDVQRILRLLEAQKP